MIAPLYFFDVFLVVLSPIYMPIWFFSDQIRIYGCNLYCDLF